MLDELCWFKLSLLKLNSYNELKVSWWKHILTKLILIGFRFRIGSKKLDPNSQIRVSFKESSIWSRTHEYIPILNLLKNVELSWRLFC